MAYLRRFLTHLRVLNRSEKTIKAYKMAVSKLLTYTDKDAKTLTNEDVEDFQATLLESISKASMATYISAWRTFFEYIETDHINFKKLKRPKIERKFPRVLTIPELKATFKICRDARERAMIGFLYYGGLRIEELTKLKRRRDVSNTGDVTVRGGKGDKDRIVCVPKEVIHDLQKYLRVAPKSEYLFPAKNGESMHPQTAYFIVKNIMKRLDIFDVHPHTFRHTIAYVMRKYYNKDNVFIQKYLGHKDPSTTAIYGQMTKVDILHEARNIHTKIGKDLLGES